MRALVLFVLDLNWASVHQDSRCIIPGCEVQRLQNHVVCALSIFVAAHGPQKCPEWVRKLGDFEEQIQEQINIELEFVQNRAAKGHRCTWQRQNIRCVARVCSQRPHRRLFCFHCQKRPTFCIGCFFNISVHVRWHLDICTQHLGVQRAWCCHVPPSGCKCWMQLEFSGVPAAL